MNKTNLADELRKQDVEKGTLLYVLLKPQAKESADSTTFFILDKSGETNIPGRTYTGHLLATEEDRFHLIPYWNKETNESVNSGIIGGVTIYKEAIETYGKVAVPGPSISFF